MIIFMFNTGFKVNKVLLTNFLASSLVFGGFMLEGNIKTVVLDAGLFALSGSVTNWLAIYMLFDRVPGFYGSGVIPLRFEEFKTGIRHLIMAEFFNRSDFGAFFSQGGSVQRNLGDKLSNIADGLELEEAFNSLLDVIMNSSFGSMLGMLGGRDALIPLREPFIERMKGYLNEELSNPGFRQILEDSIKTTFDDSSVREKLASLIDARLDEMTPEMVKNIIQEMIRKHLGWLVVWGAVFGGVIGVTLSLLQLLA